MADMMKRFTIFLFPTFQISSHGEFVCHFFKKKKYDLLKVQVCTAIKY